MTTRNPPTRQIDSLARLLDIARQRGDMVAVILLEQRLRNARRDTATHFLAA